VDAAALAAAAGGSAVGLAGIALTWWNGTRDREHQRLLVAEERVYDAAATTYLDLLTSLRRIFREMEGAHPVSVAEMSRESLQRDRISEAMTPEQRIKQLVASREEQLRLDARLATFGSGAVRDATQEFFAAEERFSDNFANPDGYEELDQAWADARKTLAKVESLVRDELGSYSRRRVQKSV
jgi:hypothetical protein